MRVYFENLGLNAEKYKKIIEKYNLKIDDNIYYDELFKEKKYKCIFDELHSDIFNVAKAELEVLKKYLIQEKFYGKIAIVDIGWHNSMQFYLEQLSDSEKLNFQLNGLYIGLQPNEKKVKYSEAFISDSIYDKYTS